MTDASRAKEHSLQSWDSSGSPFSPLGLIPSLIPTVMDRISAFWRRGSQIKRRDDGDDEEEEEEEAMESDGKSQRFRQDKQPAAAAEDRLTERAETD